MENNEYFLKDYMNYIFEILKNIKDEDIPKLKDDFKKNIYKSPTILQNLVKIYRNPMERVIISGNITQLRHEI